MILSGWSDLQQQPLWRELRNFGAVCVRRLRPYCAHVDRVHFQSLMFLVTVYTLIGDDVRLTATSRPADFYFNIFTLLALVLCSFEMVASSIHTGDYVCSFFFFLDLIATLSLILDITWDGSTILDPWEVFDFFFSQEELQSSNGGGDTSLTRAGRMSRLGTRAGRVIRMIRLIRLIRIVKVYKHVLDIWTHWKGRRGDESSRPGDGTNDEEVYAESRVGMKLSRMTTQKVIVLVLFMLIMLPLITVEQFFADLPTSSQYGADVMYRAWAECSNHTSPIACHNFERQLTMYIGYHHRQQANGCERFVNQAFKTDCKLDLGWIGFIKGSNSTTFNVDMSTSMDEHWQHLFEDKSTYPRSLPQGLLESFEAGDLHSCNNGDYISMSSNPAHMCPESLRMQEVKYIGPKLVSVHAGQDIVLVFDLRPWVLRSSVYNMLQTVFICAILAVGAMVFSHDANVLVLQPIERMISKVEKIRDNPLYAMKLGDENYREKQEQEREPLAKNALEEGKTHHWWNCWRSGESAKVQTLETKILENAIIKLGKLLALGFGEAGSEIIGKNMDDDSATVNAMIPGNKVEAVFGFCDIRNFTDTTEVLQDKVMVFVNQVAEIVHIIVDTWHGAANRNIGDAFLIVWRMREHFSDATRTKVGDMSVISFVQVVAAINKSAVLKDYCEHPALLARLPNYRVRMGFGLHYGWAIEGAIGSEFKIDASYLSPHVNMASRLEAVTKQYKVLILMSEPLMQLCSPEMAKHFRTIDHITLKGETSTSIRLHTIDLKGEGLKTENFVHKKGKNQFELRMQREKAKEEKMQPSFKVYQVFEDDKDVQIMRQDFPPRFFQLFTKGYLNYEAGEWDVARSVFQTTLNMLGEVDGPSNALLSFMARYDFNSASVTPKGWPGWRELAEM